jgi:hypothetical protein
VGFEGEGYLLVGGRGWSWGLGWEDGAGILGGHLVEILSLCFCFGVLAYGMA